MKRDKGTEREREREREIQGCIGLRGFHDVRVQGVQDKSKRLYSESCTDVTLITEHNRWKLKRQLGSYEYYEP